MSLMNHRTAKSNMETNLNFIQNMARFRRSCLYLSSSLQGSFFQILVSRKLKLFLIFTGIYILYFSCVKTKYWLFVIQKFSVVHLFIVELKFLHLIPPVFCFDSNSCSIAQKTGKLNIYLNKL